MEIKDQLGFGRSVTPLQFTLPSGSCDSHLHVVGPFERYPVRIKSIFTSPPEATLSDYSATLGTTGITRLVVVQPSFYATDNSCTLDAVASHGPNARAVVIADPAVTAEEIDRFHRQGARGIRLQTVGKGGTLGTIPIDAMRRMADLIGPYGWHFEIYVDAIQINDHEAALRSLGVPIVFDHMAHVLPESGLVTPGFRSLCGMLESGVAWVKISSAIFAASGERAQALFQANPHRAVWGSDWPHVAFRDHVQDDGQLLNDLARWFPNEADRQLILAANPNALYFR